MEPQIPQMAPRYRVRETGEVGTFELTNRGTVQVITQVWVDLKFENGEIRRFSFGELDPVP